MSDATEYAATFELIDANNDGRISAAELKDLMAALGEDITDDAARRAVELIDGDGDGAISLEEFARFMAARSADQSA